MFQHKTPDSLFDISGNPGHCRNRIKPEYSCLHNDYAPTVPLKPTQYTLGGFTVLRRNSERKNIVTLIFILSSFRVVRTKNPQMASERLVLCHLRITQPGKKKITKQEQINFNKLSRRYNKIRNYHICKILYSGVCYML